MFSFVFPFSNFSFWEFILILITQPTERICTSTSVCSLCSHLMLPDGCDSSRHHSQHTFPYPPNVGYRMKGLFEMRIFHRLHIVFPHKHPLTQWISRFVLYLLKRNLFFSIPISLFDLYFCASTQQYINFHFKISIFIRILCYCWMFLNKTPSRSRTLLLIISPTLEFIA